MAEIVLDGVSKSYEEVVAVDDVSLTIDEEELLVLVGPSGCGKTTLLRLIAGLERPTAGEIYLDGERVTDRPARKRDVALVFQEFALFPHLDVRQNLSFNLRMQGYDDIDARVERTATLLSIEGLLDRPLDRLSGGQRQRVALGRAIASEPGAFLLDEPLASLDAQLRDRMRTEIARLHQQLGCATVHVTHDQREAITVGDRIAVVRDGELQQVGPPTEVYRRPANRFVAGFIGNPPMNFLEGTLDRSAGVLDLPIGAGESRRLPVDGLQNVGGTGSIDRDASEEVARSGETAEPGGPDALEGATAKGDGAVTVGLRPEHLDVAPVDAGPSAPGHGSDGDDGCGDVEGTVDRSFPATVELVEFQGPDTCVYLRRDGLPELVARVDADTALTAGQRVRLSLSADRLHLFDGESGRRRPSTPERGET